MFCVYILQSLKDGKIYVGYSSNLRRRILEHNEGKVPSTSSRKPLNLLEVEIFKTMREAKDRELWWKSGAGRRRLKELFQSIKGGPPKGEQGKVALERLRTLGGRIQSEHQ